MTNTRFKSEVAACYYTPKISYILVGGIDSEQNLIIHTEASYSNTSIPDIASELLNYSVNIWINDTHESLKQLLGEWFGGELNFRQESEIEKLNVLYLSLLTEERIQAPGLTLPQNIEPCLKILIKALDEDLNSPQDIFFVSVGEPREVYRIFDGY